MIVFWTPQTNIFSCFNIHYIQNIHNITYKNTIMIFDQKDQMIKFSCIHTHTHLSVSFFGSRLLLTIYVGAYLCINYASVISVCISELFSIWCALCKCLYYHKCLYFCSPGSKCAIAFLWDALDVRVWPRMIRSRWIKFTLKKTRLLTWFYIVYRKKKHVLCEWPLLCFRRNYSLTVYSLCLGSVNSVV